MIGFIIFAALLSIPTIIDVHHAGIAGETITDPLSEIFKDDEHVTEMIWSIIGQPDGSHTISRPPRTGLKRTYSDSDISHPSTSKYMKKA